MALLRVRLTWLRCGRKRGWSKGWKIGTCIGNFLVCMFLWFFNILCHKLRKKLSLSYISWLIIKIHLTMRSINFNSIKLASSYYFDSRIASTWNATDKKLTAIKNFQVEIKRWAMTEYKNSVDSFYDTHRQFHLMDDEISIDFPLKFDSF